MNKEDKVTDVNENEKLDLSQERMQDNVNSVRNTDDWKVIDKTEHKGSNVFKAVGVVAAIVIILGGMAWSGLKLYDYNKPAG